MSPVPLTFVLHKITFFMKFIKSFAMVIALIFSTQLAMAQYPNITREARGYTYQVDFKVRNSSGTAQTFTYNWLLAPQDHTFSVSGTLFFEVSVNMGGGVVQNYVMTKANVDAYGGAYFEAWPSSSAISPLLYIRNSNPVLNQYSFYLAD